MRLYKTPNRIFIPIVLGIICILSCGKKGDPLPRTAAAPTACSAQWISHHILEVKLPKSDIAGDKLIGIDKLRIYYLPLEDIRPSCDDIMNRGQVIVEQSGFDLLKSNKALTLNLKDINYPSGWLIIVAMRVGGVLGVPSEVIPWFNIPT